jgi:predicted secreted protein
MDPVQEISSLQKKLREAEAHRVRKEGALQEKKRYMKELCGSTDPEKAKEVMAELREEKKALEAKLGKMLTEFKEKYYELIGD